MLVITYILVPAQSTELLRLIDLKSKYRTMEYSGGEVRHVIVTGFIGINAI